MSKIARGFELISGAAAKEGSGTATVGAGAEDVWCLGWASWHDQDDVRGRRAAAACTDGYQALTGPAVTITAR